MNINNTVKKLRRISNKCYSLINRLRFTLYNIKYGNGLCIHGFPGLYVGNDAIVNIGRKFYFSNGRHQNPLSRNVQGCIHVNDNAVLTIGDNVGASSVTIWVHESVTIGNYVNIGANTVILDSDCHSLDAYDRRELKCDKMKKKNAPIKIGNDVMIGMNCFILKGVTIGDRVVIGAGSIVTKDIPADCIAAGNPAIVVKQLIKE